MIICTGDIAIRLVAACCTGAERESGRYYQPFLFLGGFEHDGPFFKECANLKLAVMLPRALHPTLAAPPRYDKNRVMKLAL